MNYKKNRIPFQTQPRRLVDHKGRKKCNYLLIDDACASIKNSFDIGDDHLLSIALISLTSFLETQKIIALPHSFGKLSIIQILLTISNNKESQFNSEQITSSISSLKYIFRSNQMCNSYLNEDVITSICEIINNWEEIFQFNKEEYEEEVISIGDLIQIITSLLNYDVSLLDLINSMLPVQFLIDMYFSLSFNDDYVAECFSSYFCSFFDFASSDLLNESLDESIAFFNFCLSCYQKEIKPTYQYNLWSLSEIIIKLAKNFNLAHFIDLKLHDFINYAILEDDNNIVDQALRFISIFYSVFIHLEENHSENGENTDDDFFSPEEDNLFYIENLIMIPRDREKLSEYTKCYSIIVLEKIFKCNRNYLELFFKYEMPEYFISEFSNMRFDIKEAVCSLFLYIVEIIGDDFLIEMIKQNLIGMFIEYFDTGSLKYEILIGIKCILDRLQEIDFPLMIEMVVALQDDLFQETLLEIMSSENQRCSEIATIVRDMTFIEDI